MNKDSIAPEPIESQVKAIKESELALDYFETEVRSCLS